MYSEEELRESLQYSAIQLVGDVTTTSTPADHHTSSSAGIVVELPGPGAGARSRQSWTTGFAVAVLAAAALVVGAVIAHSAGSGSSPDGSAPAGGATGSDLSASPSSGKPRIADAVPHPALKLNNFITLSRESKIDHEFGAADQAEFFMIGGASVPVDVIALPPSASFDPTTAISDAQRAPVAGTTGYYGPTTIPGFVDAPGSSPNKFGPPKTTLSWQATNGTWIFIQGVNHGVNLPLSTLLAEYSALDITVAPAPLPRMPFRVGWLPDGLTVTGTSASSMFQNVELTAPGKRVDINVAPAITVGTARIVSSGTGAPAKPSASRTIEGKQIFVSVTGYDQNTATKILSNLDLSKIGKPESSWLSLAQAFND